jgi:hypothetical protein
MISRVGWLDRDGNYYPCEFYKHEEKAKELGYTDIQLEEMGWIKVFATGKGCFYGTLNATEEQIKWLFDNDMMDKTDIEFYENIGLL